MEPVIETRTGALQGVDMGAYTEYRGVPYAEPPVGENRWKPPVEKRPWTGILRAERFAAIPPQRVPDGTAPWDGVYFKEFYADPEYLRPQSEDCLYLNLWVPKGAEAGEKKLPVAFWIHGGAFAGGYGSEIEFGGAAFCREGVILVTVDYRLGALGFLAHPWLTAESGRGASGNYGLMDQIAALRWVRENIAAFGGDPDNITVFGQSAGSMSTQALVSSPLTEGMIAKAILQSGLSCEDTLLYTPTLAEAERIGTLFAQLAGAQDLAQLRALPPQTLLRAQDALTEKTLAIGISLVPNAEGCVLERTVPETYRAGKMRDIPYMVGSVNDDLGSTPTEIREQLPGRLHRECLRWSARTEAAFGRPAYVYRFLHPLPGDASGAFHSAELWYMFGTYPRWWRPRTEADAALSGEMVSCWTTFMKTGAPTADGSWEPCRGADGYVKIFA